MPTLAELERDVMSTTGFTVAYYSALEKKQKTFSYTFNAPPSTGLSTRRGGVA
jgi:hypothetical protein